MKVGLTGGYASGKSFVAAELEKLGCFIIYADRLGHEVLEPDGAAYGPALDEFGSAITLSDGRIDHRKLGSLVFASPQLLKKLEAIVHPAVFDRESALLNAFACREPTGIAVIEAAILIETARQSFFDRLIVTDCDEETQIVRGMTRDGLTREQVRARLDKQMPISEKTKYADYVIDTSGEREATIQRIYDVYRGLRAVGGLA